MAAERYHDLTRLRGLIGLTLLAMAGLELEAWLGPAPAAQALLVEEAVAKRLAIEATALRLQRRFGHPVLQRGA